VFCRFGYFVAWGERQNLLRILFENLRDPSKVLVAKDLVDIQHDAEGVTAVCADGSSFRGDILVGADGVFSRTRSKMWEMAEPANPDLVKKERDCKSLPPHLRFTIGRLTPTGKA
jgi:2-polyprenyl-6-methoxyphenol hydroxylase-like FAD-dependent oxidoreductase